MKEKNEQFLEIDIWQIVKALWQNMWIVIFSTILCGLLAFCYARYMVTPTYSSSVMLYVNSGTFSVGSTSINISGGSGTGLMETYQVILKTRNTLETVIEEADLPYTYEQLQGMISSGTVGGTSILRLTVTATDAEESATIANAIAEVLQYNISRVVSGCNVQLVESASVPMGRTAPSYTRYVEVGLLIGFLLSCAVITAISLLDDTIRNEDYLLQTFDLPVLALIPDLASQSSGYYYSKSGSGKERGV